MFRVGVEKKSILVESHWVEELPCHLLNANSWLTIVWISVWHLELFLLRLWSVYSVFPSFSLLLFCFLKKSLKTFYSPGFCLFSVQINWSSGENGVPFLKIKYSHYRFVCLPQTPDHPILVQFLIWWLFWDQKKCV